MNEDRLPSATREESRQVAQGLIGMKVTEAFYDENQLVLEFGRKFRIQFSPSGLVLHKRADVPDDDFPAPLRNLG